MASDGVSTRWPSDRRRLAAVLVACAVLAAGCGNRLSREEVLASNTVGDWATSAQRVSPVIEGSDDGAARPGAPELAETSSTNAAGLAGSVGSGGDAGGAGPALPGFEAAAGAKAPIVIGMVGWLSGIGGQTSDISREVMVAWSRAVNERGGINGHPVELLIGDDGGNESRSLSIVRDFVENQGAIAIVNYAGGTAVAVSKYARENGIPIIGGLLAEQLWTENPMMFPQAAAAEGHFWGIARLAKDSGATKIATLYCAEIAACQQANDNFARMAVEMGLEIVYQGRISFTQPDYTADCLQMRNAGAEVVVPITENTSTVRIAQSCGRQDFDPTYVMPVANDGMKDIPEFEGAIGAVVSFPWFLRSGSAALDEYGQVIERYLPNRIDNGIDYMSAAWVVGKLFERAAADVSATPTTSDILAGLWRMRGETLDGLVAGGMARTFAEGQPTAETYCVYEVKIQRGAWTAPRGMAPACR